MTIFRSYKKLKKSLKEGGVSCVSITKSYIKEINKTKKLNVFIEIFEEEALERAVQIDKKIKLGKAGRLAGMIIGLKDNICYKNHKVTASSKILKDFESLYSSTVVDRIIAEDAIIIGRINCDEFAMGSSNENTIYGPVKNPLNTKKVAGGSSGGSAAAISAGLCLVALGSDTGGSIRQPASFCGVVGLKPTYSRVSRHGLIAYASSFDQIGPLANNVYDASLVLEVISGADKFDSTASRKKVENYSEYKLQKKKFKIGYISECLNSQSLDEEVKSIFNAKISHLRKEGNIIDSVSFPYLDFLVPTYYVLTTAEASSNLSRYDGIRYGYRSKKTINLENTYLNSRTEAFGDEVKRRIMLGTFVLSAGYHEAYFTKAQKIRRLIREKTREIFKEYDFLISPTTPHTAFDIGIEHVDPTKMYLEDIFTVQANLSGNPAISIPIGNSKKTNMPIGMHIMTNDFEEGKLVAFSKKINFE
mgnify:CR=1 FL=1